MRTKDEFILCHKKLDEEIDSAREEIVRLVNHTMFAEGDSGGVMPQDIAHWDGVKQLNRAKAKRLADWIETCEELKKCLVAPAARRAADEIAKLKKRIAALESWAEKQ